MLINAVISTPRIEQMIRLDKYELKCVGTELLSLPAMKILKPSCVDWSRLLAKEASEKPITRSEEISRGGIEIAIGFSCTYFTTNFNCF